MNGFSTIAIMLDKNKPKNKKCLVQMKKTAKSSVFFMLGVGSRRPISNSCLNATRGFEKENGL